LMLPEMDGLKLCRNIRWKSNIPMIIISARQEEAVKIEGLGLGADDYVAKPFSLDELKARIQSHLRRWQRYQGNLSLMDEQVTTYQGGLVISWEKQKVEVNGDVCILTAKEFDLLKVLAQNPERVFTKMELFEHVWHQVDDEGLHTITVHVKALRKKIGDAVKKPIYIFRPCGEKDIVLLVKYCEDKNLVTYFLFYCHGTSANFIIRFIFIRFCLSIRSTSGRVL